MMLLFSTRIISEPIKRIIIPLVAFIICIHRISNHVRRNFISLFVSRGLSHGLFPGLKLKKEENNYFTVFTNPFALVGVCSCTTACGIYLSFSFELWGSDYPLLLSLFSLGHDGSWRGCINTTF